MTPAQLQALIKAGQSGANLAGMGSTASGLGNAGAGLGIYGGIQQGGVSGYGSAAANSAKLAGSLSGNKALGQYGAGAGNLLGIYSGIKQGGVGGYGGAAVNAAQLGSSLGAFGAASPGIGAAAGYAAIPLALYNEVNSWESGNTGADALGGASTGAAIGTMVMPGIGTAVGALLGAAAGALSSTFGNGRVDPENAGFNAYTQAYNKASDSTEKQKIAAQNADPYLTMAGYFDLRKNQVKGDNPLYQQYGRMGEKAFTDDLTSQINNAYKTGAVKIGASGQDVYNSVVQPWLAGKGTWNDQNKDALTGAIQQMTNQYVGGQAANQWKAIGGDSPFKDVYSGSAIGQQYQQQQQQAAQAQQAQQAQQMQAAIPKDLFKAPGMGGATTAMGAARGGHVHKVHFDDGGSYDWGNFSDPTIDNSFNTDYLDQENPFGGLNQDLGEYGNIVNAYNDPYAYGMGDSSQGGGGNTAGNTAGGLAALLKGMGISGNTSNSLAPYAALLPLLGSAFGVGQTNNKAPGLPSQYNGQVLNMGTPDFTRQQNNLSGMNMKDWLHAGEGPEINFYRNNALPATQMSAPGQQAAQALSAISGQPFAGGYQYQPIAGSGQTTVGGVAPEAPSAPTAQTATPHMGIMPVTRDPNAPPLAVMAAGGPYDSPDAAYGTSAVGHVRGPGDGTSDSIKLRNAYLSNGEYVIDAPTVSILGAGSNDAGAKKLDAFRVHVRKNAGKHLAKGKQPMQGADPSAYFYGGSV